jgi:peptidase E
MDTASFSNPGNRGERKLFVGGSISPRFISYVSKLTGKQNPAICFIPTASGDNPTKIIGWQKQCEGLPIRPYVLKCFISAYQISISFEEQLMGMDAVIVGGGNTLNMLAVWKAQGIDVALKSAYDSGIVISGVSAGALCWFHHGTTDSRPGIISTMNGLGWIHASYSPHYDSETQRQLLYRELVSKGDLLPGYASDDYSGIYFNNEKFVRCISFDAISKSYYVSIVDGKVAEKVLPADVADQSYLTLL